MEKKYEALKLEILEFDSEDIITASPYTKGDGEGGYDGDD